MDEKRVRKTTGALLAAYQDLVGSSYSPTIQEFLLLRGQAIKEAGFTRTSPVSEGFGYQNKEEQAPKDEPDPADRKERVHPSFPPTAQQEERRREPSFPIPSNAPEGEAVSNYDLLRRIQDPWND